MNTKHTLGEWRYSEQYNLITTSPRGIIEGSKTICELSIFGHKPEQETNANGLLIAAAPDLLEALQLIKDILTDWNGTETSAGKYRNLIFHAETVINKATTPTDHKQ